MDLDKKSLEEPVPGEPSAPASPIQGTSGPEAVQDEVRGVLEKATPTEISFEQHFRQAIQGLTASPEKLKSRNSLREAMYQAYAEFLRDRSLSDLLVLIHNLEDDKAPLYRKEAGDEQLLGTVSHGLDEAKKMLLQKVDDHELSAWIEHCSNSSDGVKFAFQKNLSSKEKQPSRKGWEVNELFDETIPRLKEKKSPLFNHSEPDGLEGIFEYGIGLHGSSGPYKGAQLAFLEALRSCGRTNLLSRSLKIASSDATVEFIADHFNELYDQAEEARNADLLSTLLGHSTADHARTDGIVHTLFEIGAFDALSGILLGSYGGSCGNLAGTGWFGEIGTLSLGSVCNRTLALDNAARLKRTVFNLVTRHLELFMDNPVVLFFTVKYKLYEGEGKQALYRLAELKNFNFIAKARDEANGRDARSAAGLLLEEHVEEIDDGNTLLMVAKFGFNLEKRLRAVEKLTEKALAGYLQEILTYDDHSEYENDEVKKAVTDALAKLAAAKA